MTVLASGIYVPDDTYARERHRSGTFYLNECSGIEPNYSDACRLEAELQRHDPELRVCAMKYNDFRWGIRWRNNKREEILVKTCEDENHNYLPPDSRWIQHILANDMWGPERRSILKHLATVDEKHDQELAYEGEQRIGELKDKVARRFRDAGWSQRETGDDIENFSFQYGTTRGKLPRQKEE